MKTKRTLAAHKAQPKTRTDHIQQKALHVPTRFGHTLSNVTFCTRVSQQRRDGQIMSRCSGIDVIAVGNGSCIAVEVQHNQPTPEGI